MHDGVIKEQTEMANILITGANGTIGTATIRALREAGVAVKAGIRNPEKGKALAALGAEVVAFDLEKPESMKAALQGVEHVFFITPFHPGVNEQLQVAVNLAREAGAKHLVRLSSAGADPNSPVIGPRLHGQAEAIVKKSGIPTTIVRPTFFMDNLINYTNGTIQKDGAFYGAAGEGKTAYVSSRDIGRAVAVILQNPEPHAGREYVLTGPEAISEHQVAETIGAARGKLVKYVNLSPKQLADGMKSQGLPEFAVELFVFLESAKAKGWAAAMSPDLERLVGDKGETMEAFMKREAARLA
jgi:uncharacterized protein YbjT (DUF2867 family)